MATKKKDSDGGTESGTGNSPPPYRPPSPAPSYHTVDVRMPNASPRPSRRPFFERFMPRRRAPSTPTPTPTQALDAIKQNNEELFRVLLQAGLDPNTVLVDGSRLLDLTADLGREGMVQALLDHNADLVINGGRRRRDVTRLMPLQLAARNGHTQIVTALLAAGADVNAGSATDAGSLSLAAENGHEDTVRVLLDAGADVTSRVPYTPTTGTEAFRRAVANGHRTIAILLHDAGASKAASSPGGYYIRVLGDAIEHDWPELVQRVLAVCRENGPRCLDDLIRCGSLLMRPAATGNVRILEQLLRAGFDPNYMIGSHSSLVVAILGGHSEAVRVLLDWGADVNARGVSLFARGNSNPEIRKMFMEGLLGVVRCPSKE